MKNIKFHDNYIEYFSEKCFESPIFKHHTKREIDEILEKIVEGQHYFKDLVQFRNNGHLEIVCILNF